MKRGFIIFFKILIVLVGISALAFMIWEPQVEGRNVNATLFEIYFKDPFLAYVYVASIPFFVVLFQIFKMLGYANQNGALLRKSLKSIRFCATAMICFAFVGEMLIALNDSDDRAGGVFMGMLIIFSSALIFTLAAIFDRRLRK